MDEAVFVDEFRPEDFDAERFTGVILAKFVLALGLGRDGDRWFRIVVSDDGTAAICDDIMGPTPEEIAAFERALNPTPQPLQQPARGVRVTGAGTLRVVK